MIIVMTPIVLSIFIYYLYISGYFMNIITELYTAYKILNTYVIIPVSNTYNQLNYYVFYKNRYIVIIDSLGSGSQWYRRSNITTNTISTNWTSMIEFSEICCQCISYE